MSIEAMSWVFKHSEATQGERLVLLALADNADDDTWEAYPSVVTLARKARLKRRQTQRCLRKLEEDGRVSARGTSQYDTTIYRVEQTSGADRVAREQMEAEAGGRTNDAPASSATRNVPGATPPGAQMTPEPSERNPQEPSEHEEDARASSPVLEVDEAARLMAGDARVLEKLRTVRRANGSKAPTLEAVEKVRDRYPALDLERVADELVFWAEHGNGARRQIKSVMGTFATFCRGAEEDRVRGGSRASASVSPGTPVASASDWDAKMDFGVDA